MEALRAVIVVPCFNEARRLDVEAFKAFSPERHSVHFLFVDDGSSDETWTLLQSLANSNGERFSVLQLPQNQGKGEAVRQGIQQAFESNPDSVGFWDADLATPLKEIEGFCDLLTTSPKIDMILGSRVQLLGRQIKRRLIRHYLGRLFATAVSLTLKLAVYDTQCGAKLFRATPETRILFEEPFVTRWIFDVELIARMIKNRHGTDLPPADEAICEIPLQQWTDVAGSKLKTKDFVAAVFELVTIYRRYRTV